MDRFDAMRAFVRIVERRSFTLAAEDLGLPRSTLTDAVKSLEARLGVRLLNRTTRHVSPTVDGEAYFQRCLRLIAELEDTEAAFAGSKPKGLLHVDVHGTLARHFIFPGLPAFLERYPGIQLFMSDGDRFVDLIREGIDCVLRVGELRDSDMIARRIGLLQKVTCASQSYIKQYGLPESIDDLAGHRMVGFRSPASGGILPLEFTVGGALRSVSLPCSISMAGSESYVEAARLGLGLTQVLRYHIADDLARGTLVAILPDHPPSPSPVSLLYPHNRQLSPRVRVFVEWLSGEFVARSRADIEPFVASR
jgi:DNA-binding transcriptional LysR family regulator